MKKSTSELQTATFGAGCFWGVEETFRKIKGVMETAVGYMGGNLKNPTYENVCTDKTGHAEVMQIKYDPKQVSYEELLNVFWNNHNPTTVNQQGPDFGTQYRSVIFYHTKEQEKIAKKSKDTVNTGRFDGKVVTEIVPATEFYRAEEYHQRYFEKRGGGICH